MIMNILCTVVFILGNFASFHRHDMLAHKDLNWSIPNARLYNEAFTGRGNSIPRYSHCLGDDQSSSCLVHMIL